MQTAFCMPEYLFLLYICIHVVNYISLIRATHCTWHTVRVVCECPRSLSRESSAGSKVHVSWDIHPRLFISNMVCSELHLSDNKLVCNRPLYMRHSFTSAGMDKLRVRVPSSSSSSSSSWLEFELTPRFPVRTVKNILSCQPDRIVLCRKGLVGFDVAKGCGSMQ